MSNTTITPEDVDALAAFFRDPRTPLSVKMTLGYEPDPLLDILAHHAEQARLAERERAFKAGWRKCWCRDPHANTASDGGMQAAFEQFAENAKNSAKAIRTPSKVMEK